MKTNQLLAFLLAIFLLIGCNKKIQSVVNPNDYNAYLNLKTNKSLNFTTSEIDFWQKKFDKAPNQNSYLGKIASNYSVLFDITANIDYLYKAEELLLESNTKSKFTNVNTLRSLARNYISQHRFKEALTLAEKALAIGDGKLETQKLLFDVQMELGNYKQAENNLKALSLLNNDYDFIIRNAKWQDHNGNLKSAISLLKKAAIQAELNENETLQIWTYTNLADFYGHNGEISEAYRFYLKALKLNPNNSYALKGIAWIAFSNDKNTNEARRIIDIISKNHNSPDFYLLKSEIAEYENDAKAKKSNLDAYFKMLSQKNYGVMYNKYNALIYSDTKTESPKAVEIAFQEIKNRPTPDSYNLLAWAYYNEGKTKEAFEVASKYVANKTFEPESNYHLAVIYKANNKTDKIEPIKKDLQSSLFELGPNMIAKINSL